MAPKRVVYLLGAGFSAPLGIPTMSEFIRRSRQLKREERLELSYFDDVFKEMTSVDGVGKYFKGEPFNLEDTLSILEMSRGLDGGKSFKLFTRYICDVITRCTPKFQSPDLKTARGNWDTEFVSTGIGEVNRFACFVASLLGIALQGRNIDLDGSIRQEIEVEQPKQRVADYAVVTLNYDMVLDNILAVIRNAQSDHTAPQVISYQGVSLQPTTLPIVKVHGSVHDGSVIPPTFNKGLYLKELPPAWGEAFDLLKQANEIRIIGYSLPRSDAYIQYILKSAIIQTQELEEIDVICLDPDKSVRERYDSFISYPNYRFFDRNTTDYLATVQESHRIQTDGLYGDITRRVEFTRLEAAHKKFCSA